MLGIDEGTLLDVGIDALLHFIDSGHERSPRRGGS